MNNEPKYVAGETIYNEVRQRNEILVKVAWDESANGYNGGWRYYTMGFNTLHPYPAKTV